MTSLPHAERHGADDVLEIYDRAAGRYDLVNAIASLGTGRWYRERTIRTLDLPEDAAVLDVGCGTGTLALPMKDSPLPLERFDSSWSRAIE